MLKWATMNLALNQLARLSIDAVNGKVEIWPKPHD